MSAGAALMAYCMVSTASPTIDSLFLMKTASPSLVLSVTDQVALLSIPSIATLFLPIM